MPDEICLAFLFFMKGKKMIKLITVGSIKESFYKNKIEEYISQIKKHTDISVVEFKDESIPSNAGEAVCRDIKKREGEKILSKINNTDYVIALCIEGTLTDSNKLCNIIKQAASSYAGDITFIIGGSLGLSDAVIKRANYKLSFSRMTFPHQLMRVMLLEQIYLNVSIFDIIKFG